METPIRITEVCRLLEIGPKRGHGGSECDKSGTSVLSVQKVYAPEATNLMHCLQREQGEKTLQAFEGHDLHSTLRRLPVL